MSRADREVRLTASRQQWRQRLRTELPSSVVEMLDEPPRNRNSEAKQAAARHKQAGVIYVCVCQDPVVDGLGECQSCNRKPLSAMRVEGHVRRTV